MANDQDFMAIFLNSFSYQLSTSSAYVNYSDENFALFNTGVILNVISRNRKRYHRIFINDNYLCIESFPYTTEASRIELSNPSLISKVQNIIDHSEQ